MPLLLLRFSVVIAQTRGKDFLKLTHSMHFLSNIDLLYFVIQWLHPFSLDQLTDNAITLADLAWTLHCSCGFVRNGNSPPSESIIPRRRLLPIHGLIPQTVHLISLPRNFSLAHDHESILELRRRFGLHWGCVVIRMVDAYDVLVQREVAVSVDTFICHSWFWGQWPECCS